MTTTQTIEPQLSVFMRDGSRVEHEAAEGSVFMDRLLAGGIAEQTYLDYLGHLREIYAAMEEVGNANRSDAAVSAVHDPALERVAAIEADIAFWSQRTGAEPAEPGSPATKAYVERLRASADWGGFFVAHHYTRYLGDLSGGQAIGAILSREYGLSGSGVEFYAFPEIAKPKLYKDAYRERLDALALTSEEKHAVVEEVKVAFSLNQALFAELSRSLAA